jgi:hypothetical protein
VVHSHCLVYNLSCEIGVSFVLTTYSQLRGEPVGKFEGSDEIGERLWIFKEGVDLVDMRVIVGDLGVEDAFEVEFILMEELGRGRVEFFHCSRIITMN